MSWDRGTLRARSVGPVTAEARETVDDDMREARMRGAVDEEDRIPYGKVAAWGMAASAAVTLAVLALAPCSPLRLAARLAGADGFRVVAMLPDGGEAGELGPALAEGLRGVLGEGSDLELRVRTEVRRDVLRDLVREWSRLGPELQRELMREWSGAVPGVSVGFAPLPPGSVAAPAAAAL